MFLIDVRTTLYICICLRVSVFCLRVCGAYLSINKGQNKTIKNIFSCIKQKQNYFSKFTISKMKSSVLSSSYLLLCPISLNTINPLNQTIFNKKEKKREAAKSADRHLECFHIVICSDRLSFSQFSDRSIGNDVTEIFV